MKASKAIQAARIRRIRRVRAKISGTAARPRLSVRRSLNHVYAQLVDDTVGKTLVAFSDTDLKSEKLTKTQAALEVGKNIAERAKAKGISQVVFDRRGRRYHGRVKAVADGAREGGLTF